MGEPEATLRLVVANEWGEMRRLERAVASFLESRSVPEKTAYAARVVVEEIVTNAIRYGFADGGRHEIRVVLQVMPRGVALTFEDDGREFDPRPKAAPLSGQKPTLDAMPVGGLGLQLVGAIANRVDYRRDSGRNVVEIRVSDEWGPAR